MISSTTSVGQALPTNPLGPRTAARLFGPQRALPLFQALFLATASYSPMIDIFQGLSAIDRFDFDCLCSFVRATSAFLVFCFWNTSYNSSLNNRASSRTWWLSLFNNFDYDFYLQSSALSLPQSGRRQEDMLVTTLQDICASAWLAGVTPTRYAPIVHTIFSSHLSLKVPLRASRQRVVVVRLK